MFAAGSLEHSTEMISFNRDNSDQESLVREVTEFESALAQHQLEIVVDLLQQPAESRDIDQAVSKIARGFTKKKATSLEDYRLLVSIEFRHRKNEQQLAENKVKQLASSLDKVVLFMKKDFWINYRASDDQLLGIAVSLESMIQKKRDQYKHLLGMPEKIEKAPTKKEFRERHQPVESKDSQSMRIADVWMAAELGALDFIRHERSQAGLLQKIGFYNKQDELGRTMLHCASSAGKVRIVDFLIKQKASWTLKDKDGASPLHLAAIHGHKNVVERLLGYKASWIHAKDENGWTPLHGAALYGKDEIVSILLENGAVINARDKQGETPLHKAVCFGQEEVLKFFEEYPNLEVMIADNNGHTPLYHAVRLGLDRIVKWILSQESWKNPSDISDCNHIEQLILLESVQKRSDLVQLLMCYQTLNQKQQECWDAVERRDDEFIAERIKSYDLSTLPERVNARYLGGKTLLHRAASIGAQNIVELLLEHQANPNQRDYCTNLPIHYAALGGHKHLIRTLLIQDRNLIEQTGEYQRTPLHQAVLGGHLDTVAFLITWKANVNARAEDGSTSLHFALKKGYESIAQLLLENETVDVMLVDQKGLSPLHYAVRFNLVDFVRIIFKHPSRKGLNNESDPNHIKQLLKLPRISDEMKALIKKFE